MQYRVITLGQPLAIIFKTKRDAIEFANARRRCNQPAVLQSKSPGHIWSTLPLSAR